jgi:uncharacterized membrane protein YgaE (UPF0421/DUF939 family)
MRALTQLFNKLIPEPLYLLKCLAGVAICYLLYIKVPNYPFFWALVSVVIATAPDNSNKLAYDRMIANLLGCGVGLCLFPLYLPELLSLCIGVVLILAIGYALKISSTLRSAMAALIIVSIHERQSREWYVSIERVVCVIIGCLAALLVALVFNLIARQWAQRKRDA